MNRNDVLDNAGLVINGPRRAAYGDVKESFVAVANGWASIFHAPVTPLQVAMAMVWLKVCRESNAHGEDNLVDICGYAALAAELSGE